MCTCRLSCSLWLHPWPDPSLRAVSFAVLLLQIRMNLFRSLPKPLVKTGGDVEEEEQPFMDPQWSHLVLVYELLLRVVRAVGCGWAYGWVGGEVGGTLLLVHVTHVAASLSPDSGVPSRAACATLHGVGWSCTACVFSNWPTLSGVLSVVQVNLDVDSCLCVCLVCALLLCARMCR